MKIIVSSYQLDKGLKWFRLAINVNKIHGTILDSSKRIRCIKARIIVITIFSFETKQKSHFKINGGSEKTNENTKIKQLKAIMVNMAAVEKNTNLVYYDGSSRSEIKKKWKICIYRTRLQTVLK